MTERHRMWKYVGLIHCPDGMIAVSYAIDRLNGDMDSEGEEGLMALSVDVIRDCGFGVVNVRFARKIYKVHAQPVHEHPMQARQWLGEH